MLCNPGTQTGWIGGTMPRGTPVLAADDPAVYDRIVGEVMTAEPVSVG